METKKLCQSCSMPLQNAELMGTEKDGSINTEYCRYCYADGRFTNPNMTLDEMKTVVKAQMEIKNINTKLINQALVNLPNLKRWKK